MPDLSQSDLEELEDAGRQRRRHKKKRGHRKKVVRQIIIIGLFVLACIVALAAWHFLVQDPTPRTR
jgi:hypothetical protein